MSCHVPHAPRKALQHVVGNNKRFFRVEEDSARHNTDGRDPLRVGIGSSRDLIDFLARLCGCGSRRGQLAQVLRPRQHLLSWLVSSPRRTSLATSYSQAYISICTGTCRARTEPSLHGLPCPLAKKGSNGPRRLRPMTSKWRRRSGFPLLRLCSPVRAMRGRRRLKESET
jgi:hypothetical protein